MSIYWYFSHFLLFYSFLDLSLFVLSIPCGFFRCYENSGADDMSENQSEGRAGLTAYSVHGKLSIQFALKKVKAQCTICHNISPVRPFTSCFCCASEDSFLNKN